MQTANLVHLRHNMAPTLNQILSWLTQPKVWRFTSLASSVVGLLCYALSSSFNLLFGKWTKLKIFLYSVFSFIICFALLSAKTWRRSNGLGLKAHLAFSVLTITSVYSFFFDKVVNGKPDAYTLISCAAFAFMSLSLSKQTRWGFEVDLLYFFCDCLTTQLMKTKLLLVIVGASFSYSLIILRSYVHTAAESVHLVRPSLDEPLVEDQHFVVIQMDSNAEETNTDTAIQVDSPHANAATGNAYLIMPPEVNSDIMTPDALLENGDSGLQDLMVTQVDSHSQQGNGYSESNTDSAIRVDSLLANAATGNAHLVMPQEANSDTDSAPIMTLDALPENGDLGLQDITHVHSHSQQGNGDSETNTESAIQVDSLQANTATGNAHLIMPQEVNTDSDSAPIMTLDALPENGDLGLQDLLVTQGHSHSQQGNDNNESNTDSAIQVDSLLANAATSNAHLVVPQEANSDSAPVMTLDALPESGDLGLQDLMVTQVDSHPQQGNSESDRILLRSYEMALANMSRKLNRVIWKQVKEYHYFAGSMKLNEIWVHTYEILKEEEIINDLRKTVKHMVVRGFETECCNAYCIFRRKFLNKCLCRIGLKEVNFSDVEEQNIESLIVAFNVALRILFPIERKLWGCLFPGFSSENFLSYWRRVEIDWWAKFIELETRFCCDKSQVTVLDSGVHRITRNVMEWLEDVCKDRDGAAYFHIAAMILELLESNLDAMSKSYKNPALGYLFMANNSRYIQLMAINDPLKTHLGEDWTRIQSSKILQNIEHCLTFSWNYVLDFLKLESYESAAPPKVAAKSMKYKLHLFNLHFKWMCSNQCTWFFLDEQLRRTMIWSLEKRLLPVYENFLGRFRDVVGWHAHQYIEYGTSDIQYQLGHLLLESRCMKQ